MAVDNTWVHCSAAVFLYVACITWTSVDAFTTDLPRRTQPIWNETYTDRLKNDLLIGYDKFARPAQHFNATVVELFLTAKHFDINEFASTMTMDVWFRVEWTDPKLRWSTDNYDGLNALHLAAHEIWQPDIVLYNSAATSFGVGHYDMTQVLVMWNGSVLWFPRSRLEVFCSLDLRRWPFDQHSCDFRLGSWMYDRRHLDIVLFNDSFMDYTEMVNDEWQMLGAKHERREVFSCCTEFIVEATFTVTLQRRPGAYHAVILAPATVAIILCLTTFWLAVPARTAEKLFLGGVSAVLLVGFIVYLARELPVLVNKTPYVVVFYSWSLYLVCISMVMTVVVANLSRPQHPCPRFLRDLLTGRYGRFLLITHRAQQPLSPEVQPLEHLDLGEEGIPAGASPDRLHLHLPDGDGWLLLAAAVDRLFFVVYCITFSVLALVLYI